MFSQDFINFKLSKKIINIEKKISEFILYFRENMTKYIVTNINICYKVVGDRS